ncbi:ribose-phosphate diphosphokinase [Thiobacillus sedimenti]|uniref:ribose-phosphate diphosphokinase n=1 Tax=Thiobacillus sedimenti TaxID=3110231 RepID=A0ABZ1CMJ8_9PROT|nr:ribose-phosphate pyrophosphokinase [Thiobacillus sp. SCUT-2]WRS40429.1 ribose-phosphate pyrophosphokinase [Thiobacillus sp. SCUT-2]
MRPEPPCLFALDASRACGERVAAALGLALCRHEARDFEDGEHKMRPLENVRGRDAYVIHSLYGEPGMSANDKLIRLLFFVATLKDASAARVTAICPYLAYARKDRRTKPRDPLGSRYVAQLFEAVGCDRVVTLDVHNPAAYQNAFRIPAEHLEARKLFVSWFAAHLGDEAIVVVSPDAGGVKRAAALRDSLARALGRAVGSAFLEKYRSGGVVSGDAVIGDVSGATAVVVDDLVSSGTTLARAAVACRTHGARRVLAAATHGVFAGGAETALAEPALDKLLVTDSIPPSRIPAAWLGRRVEVLETAPLLAEAVRRLHGGGSLVELLQD